MTRSNSHLLVMAGGTGGHVFPALAVATALRSKGARITWLGTKRGLEARVVPGNDIDIHWISVQGLRGKGLLSWVKAPFNLAIAIWQSLRIIRLVKPDCVLGMGGFVAGPGGLAAWLLRTPLVVHEQNAVAGLTNKYLAKIAARVLGGFPNIIDLPASTKWVGNPVRKEITALPKKELEAAEQVNVLVIGGSQGAHSFNVHLPGLFEKQITPLNIWHQSGAGRSAEVVEKYATLSVDARVDEFIEDMAVAYHWADVLVCRAGAMTIAECCAAGKPALLVPFPHSAGEHQDFNAQFLVDAGAAVMINNSDLGQSSASEAFAELIASREKLESMGAAALQMHKPNALNDVVSVCEEYLNA